MACCSAMEDAPIAQAHPFPSGARVVVDVGGGQGGFLAEALKTDPTPGTVDVVRLPEGSNERDLLAVEEPLYERET